MNTPYTWSRACFSPQPDCTGAKSVCAPTQTWYWILAAALGVTLIVANKKR